MAKITSKDHLLENGIQTGIAPTPEHAKIAAAEARANVKKSGQDTGVGLVKKSADGPNDFETKSNSKDDGISIYAMMGLIASTDMNRFKQDSDPVSLSYDQLLAKGKLDQADIYNADPVDPRVRDMEVGEYVDQSTGRRSYYVGEALTNFRGVQRELPLGPDNFKMKSIGQVQTEMVSAIAKAAAITGVPATLLGAMAGKETMFGKGQISNSGAEGLFQQTDGYLKANYVNNKKQSALIAQHVPEAAQYFADGQISINEARKLAWNPEAAAIMTGLRAKALAEDKKFDLNNKNTWTFVYTDHNAGRGSLNKLLNGGMTDGWIRDLNPSMYRGVSSAADVLAIADRDMKLWGNRFDKLTTQLGMSTEAPEVRVAASGVPVTASPAARSERAERQAAATSHTDKSPASIKSTFETAVHKTSEAITTGTHVARGAVGFAAEAISSVASGATRAASNAMKSMGFSPTFWS